MNEHLDALRAAYDCDAPRRNEKMLDRWRLEVIDDFLSRLNDGDTVLELGAGTGHAAAYVAAKGFRVRAIDLSPANVEYARARGIDARVGDFTDPQFHAGTFDGLFALNATLHVPKDLMPGVLSTMRRSLEPGGIAMIAVWGGFNHEGPVDHEWTEPPRFFVFYSDDDFAALPTPGFRALQCRFRHADAEGDLHPQVLILEAIDDRDDFTSAVIEVLEALQPGDVMAYGEVASEAGHPGAARAVGNLLRTVPGLPWWRVVNAAGRLAPGVEKEQAERLRAEGVRIVRGRVKPTK